MLMLGEFEWIIIILVIASACYWVTGLFIVVVLRWIWGSWISSPSNAVWLSFFLLGKPAMDIM